MATEWISPTWRMPEVSNQSKFENYSLDFNGGTEAIDIGVSSLAQNDPYSLSFWMKRNGSSVFGGTMLTLGNGTMVNNIVLWWKNSTTLTISNGQGTNYYRDLPSTTYNIGQWYHISIVGTIGTYSPVDLEVYLDGVPLVHTSTSSAISANQSTSAIGKLPNNAGFNWTGVMSNLSIFDYKLSTDQINYLYNSGTPQNPMAISGQPPIAYYPLGGGSTGDAGTSPNTLTVPNESVPSATVFDVSGTDYIKVNNSPSIEPAKNLTVSVWVNWKTGSNTYSYAINKDYNGSNGSYAITRVNQPRFYIFTSTGVVVSPIASSVNLTDTGWHHLVGTYDGSYVRFYVDGEEIGSGTAETGDIIYNTEDLLIGAYEPSGNLSPDGEQSNVQIWDTSLSATEITTLYNNGVPLLTGTQPQASNLKVWYPMNVDTSTWNGSDWIIGDSTATYLNSIGPISTSNTFPTTINFGNDSSLNPSDTNKLTLSIWFNSTSTLGGATGYTIFGRGPVANAANGCYTLMARGGGGDIQFWFHDGSGTSPNPILQSSNAASTYMDGKWHHIAITVDGTLAQPELKMYIDNNLEHTTTSPNTGINDVTQDLYLGQKQYTYSHLGAAYSNFCMFNTVLDATGDQSINSLYNNGTPPEDISSYSNLKFWTKLNNLTTGIIDNSSNTNNGTISGEIVLKNLVVSALNGLSSGMTTANLVTSDLTRSIPYSSYSMELDGTADYIDCGSDSSLSPSSFTFSVWSKSDLSDGGWVTKYASENYGFGIYSGSIYLNIKTSAGWGGLSVTASSYLTADKWHNIVGTYDETDLKIYVDGDLAGTLAKAGPITYSSQNTRIGNLEGTSALDFNGSLSNVAIWNSELTQDQILTIYNGGVPNDISSLSPVSWWSLAGDSYYNGSDWICPDLGSGGNNGTSSGIATTGLVGNGPGSTANGLGTSMNIPANLKGNAPNSNSNAFSVNMNSADRVADVPA